MVEIVWEFQVRPGSETEFEFHYSSNGSWAVLFGQSPKYHGTRLLRDSDATDRYFTVDTWETQADFLAFRDARKSDYLALDQKCDALTEMEKLVGVFEVL